MGKGIGKEAGVVLGLRQRLRLRLSENLTTTFSQTGPPDHLQAWQGRAGILILASLTFIRLYRKLFILVLF